MSERPRSGDERLPFHDSEAPWERWRMGELRTPREEPAATLPSTREAERRQAAFQRQAELHALREKVTEEARAAGHQAGFAAGHAEGYEAGLAEGQEEGRRQAREEYDRQARESLDPLESLAAQFGEALARLDEEIAAELVELALATGRQLAGEALKARPRQVLEIVRALLHAEPALTGKPRLWLHPRDHALVEEHLGQELAAVGWVLQPDAQLSRGGCRVTGANGELDATWESRWQAVKRQVRQRRPRRSHGEETPP